MALTGALVRRVGGRASELSIALVARVEGRPSKLSIALVRRVEGRPSELSRALVAGEAVGAPHEQTWREQTIR